MGQPAVVCEIKGHVAWLTINRASRRNTLVPPVLDLLWEHLRRLEAEEMIRVVCLTGAGEEAFCAGVDLRAVGGGVDVLEASRRYARLLQKMLAFPKPLVARLNGDCTGGGLGLMLACDLAYAREGARLGTPEARLGLFPLIMAPLIFRNAGRKKTAEMIYTARLYPAVEAEAMGLITRALPDPKFDETVAEMLSLIAANCPTAIRLGRRALAAVEEMDLAPAMAHLGRQLEALLQTEDAAEGARAFLEKRAPRWRNR